MIPDCAIRLTKAFRRKTALNNRDEAEECAIRLPRTSSFRMRCGLLRSNKLRYCAAQDNAFVLAVVSCSVDSCVVRRSYVDI